MEELHFRRRRPITYGKPSHWRSSAISDVFSVSENYTSQQPSPTPTSPTLSTLPTEILKPQRIHEQYAPNQEPVASMTEATCTKETADRRRNTKASNHGRLPVQESDLCSSTTKRNSPSAQLQFELMQASSNTYSMFDVPLSSEEEPISRKKPTRRRKTVSQLLEKARPTAKPSVIHNTSNELFRTAQTNSIERTGRHSKANKLTESARVTKHSSRPTLRNSLKSPSVSSRGPLHIPTKQRPECRHNVRQTRSQSHQPSLHIHAEPQDVSYVSFKADALLDAKLHRRRARDLPTISYGNEGQPCPIQVAMHPQKPPDCVITKRKHDKGSKEESSGPSLVGKSTKPAQSARFDLSTESGLVQNAPSRKRLIDRLGEDLNHPRKRSCSPSGGDESDRDITIDTKGRRVPRLTDELLSNGLINLVPEDSSHNLIADTATAVAATVERLPVFNSSRAAKITYARERSFKADEALNEDDLLNFPMPHFAIGGRRRFVSKPGVSELQKEHGTGMMKSIHALRAAGEKNRFIDDVEELFDDIEGNKPLSRKRSGYLEIASKVQEKSFIRSFRANSFEDRLFSLANNQMDEIASFALAYILYGFVIDDSTPRTILHLRDTGIFAMLSTMLDADTDINIIARNRKTNMSKSAQIRVFECRNAVEKGLGFASIRLKTISPQLLALKFLEELMTRYREAGVLEDLLPDGVVRRLLGIIKPFVTMPEPSDAQYTFLQLAVSILESVSSGSLHLVESDLGVFSGLVPLASSWNADPLLFLLVRLSINITNNRPEICDVYATSFLLSSLTSVIRRKFHELGGELEEEQRLLSLDLLVLSLALMINFAEVSPNLRKRIDMPADAISDSNVDSLLRIFLEKLERAAEADSMEESQTLVGFGYLSVLLGNLCQDDHIRYKVCLQLPNSSILSLLGAMEEFVAHHRKVDMMLETDGTQDAFTTRLEGVVTRLKHTEGVT